MKKLLITFLILSTSYSFGQDPVSVSNKISRMDTQENIVDVHDGRVIRFEDTFYWYGTAYGNTNGFTTQNYYQVYSSKDLKTWKKEGRLLPDQPEGVYYRPHVIYNQKNDNYVLWYNWYPQLWDGQFGVAVSDNPAGPFKIINENVQMVNSDIGLGDFGLFVDDDYTAYISYNTIQNHQVSIEELDEDYTGSTMNNGGIIAEHMEAGSQFKRDGKYYLLTDYTCCFCNYGSGARVYISESPTTGYKLTGNINRRAGNYSAILNDGVKTGTIYETLARTDSIFEAIEMNNFSENKINTIEIHLFTGNRPENCGDVSNPRVHPEIETPKFKISFWDYDRWKKLENLNISMQKSALSEIVKIDLLAGQYNRLKIQPENNFRYDEIYINEISVSSSEKAIQDIKFFITGSDIPQKPIIPAQQTYVMELETPEGKEFIWMGDLWGSASDNIKGHDYQYWSKPLEFNEDGTIQALQWTDSWEVKLK